jgi:hypothetical protein
MSFRNSITIVASPRPRVGKTLLARLLTDFHLQEGRAVAGFDLNAGEGMLAKFLPGHVTRSAIDDIKGQMALFDRLIADDGVTKIVDLGHTSFEPFFALAIQFGFADEARSRGIAPAVLYPLTPDRTSVEAYRKLCSRMSELTLAPVHNEILGPAQYRDKYGLMGSATTVVRLPVLAPRLRRYVETPPFSFADSRADSRLATAFDVPIDVNIELQRWLRRIYLEFRELDLRILLTDLKSSIRL